jgi:hypothetical protein
MTWITLVALGVVSAHLTTASSLHSLLRPTIATLGRDGKHDLRSGNYLQDVKSDEQGYQPIELDVLQKACSTVAEHLALCHA